MTTTQLNNELKSIDDVKAIDTKYTVKGTRSTKGRLLKAVTSAIDNAESKNTEADIKELFEHLGRLLPKLGLAPVSLRQNMSSFRKIISDKFGKQSRKHMITKEAMKFPEALWAGVNEKAKLALEKPMVDVPITTFYKNLETASKGDWADNVIAIQMATGLRSIEALNPEVVFRESKAGAVNQSGVMKSKAEEPYREIKGGLEKPLLGIDFKTLKKLKDTVSKEVKKSNKTIQEISHILNEHINQRARVLFGREFTSHKMRGLYVAVAYREHIANGGRERLNPFIQRVLGHENVGTSVSYTNIRITDDVKAAGADIKADVAELKAEVVELKADVVELKAEVGVVNIDGHDFLVNTKKRGDTYERLSVVIARMRVLGVVPTQRKLRQLGYSARYTTRARNEGLL